MSGDRAHCRRDGCKDHVRKWLVIQTEMRNIPSMPAMTKPVGFASSDDAHYQALKSRDSRFDGQFFTGVTSTGVYCRPVCKVRTPRPENCRFFPLAAQAEQAGFRPCLRCRPELAPLTTAPWLDPAWSTQDASAILARQAVRLIETPDAWPDAPVSISTLCDKLGVTQRHLRRIFQTQWGVSPMEYLQTRRLLCAKQLLTDTSLPVHRIASLSGFSSVRRFNDAFVSHYRLQPSALRKGESSNGAISLRCAYRRPYDFDSLLHFFATRALQGMEEVDPAGRTLRRTLRVVHGAADCCGWVEVHFPENEPVVEVLVSESLTGALPLVLARVRHWLDLDADAARIEERLDPHFPGATGMRIPGTLDGFELSVRAILGQQVTVAAARTITQRLINALGQPLLVPYAGLTHVFPDAKTLALTAAETLGALGIVRQRQQAIAALARQVCDGKLHLHPGADVPTTLAALQSLPGIGPWTAQYIAMRALGWPDAFPGGDVALQSALGVRQASRPAQSANLLSQAWRPWRSYAVIRLWAGKMLPNI